MKLVPECAVMAAEIDAAEPSCKYGALCQTLHKVGVSRPVSGAPRRVPLDGLIVPTFWSRFVALLVKAAPL